MQPARDITHTPYTLHYDRPGDDTLVVRLAGSWKLEDGLPATTELQQQLEGTPRVRRLVFDAHDVTAWDSGLVTFVREVVEQSTSRQMVVDQRGLPAGVQRLLALAAAVPEQEAARRRGARPPCLVRIGTAVLALAGRLGHAGLHWGNRAGRAQADGGEGLLPAGRSGALPPAMWRAGAGDRDPH